MSSSQFEIVRKVSEMIYDNRSVKDVVEYAEKEKVEFDVELANGSQGPDGVIGESVDIIICYFDVILREKPDITLEEINALFKKKTQKWYDKYTSVAY